MNKKTVLTWLARASGLVLAVSYLLVMVTLGFLGIMPGLYLLLFAVVTAPIVFWLYISLFKSQTKPRKQSILTGVAIILSAICLYAFSSLYATVTFLADLDKSQASYISYSVVAKKERHISLDEAKSATLTQNDTTEAVTAELKKLTTAEQKSVDTLAIMLAALNDKQTELVIMRDSQLEIMQEADHVYYDTLEVLATFRVESASSRVASTVDIAKPFILYISGIDTYGEVASVSRSDVNMLMVVNPQQHKILLVNTPRDYYVQLHGTSGTRDKLTHAGVYGIDMSIKTLEDLYGTSINSYARVNFSSLISIVDTLGGITVYSDYNFSSFTQGDNRLNGARALEFSRERYSFTEGDRTRGMNQQRVIEAIVRELQGPAVLTHYNALLATLKTSLETNIRGDVLSAFANKQFEELPRWSIESISVTGAGKLAPTHSMGATPLYVMEPDAASLDAAKHKIHTYLGR